MADNADFEEKLAEVKINLEKIQLDKEEIQKSLNSTQVS